jgi:ABC-type transport system involved in Fe-S cluster assembly fused permease/ATPase subunit
MQTGKKTQSGEYAHIATALLINACRNDSIVSYETVKYFNAEAYEFNRYREALKKYQNAEYKVTFSLNIMNVTHDMVFMLSLLVSCFIAA